MKKNWILVILICLVGCGGNKGLTSPSTDPSPTTTPTSLPGNLTCSSGTLRLTGDSAGYAQFKRSQHDWYTPDEAGDYRYYMNNRGGVGNTLEYIGCAGGEFVWLEWEFNSFRIVAVREPWSGQTDLGLKINDDQTRFHSLYPNAHHQTGPSYEVVIAPYDWDIWEDGPLRVVLKNSKVYIIEADWSGSLFGGDPDTTPSTRTIIGPWPSWR